MNRGRFTQQPTGQGQLFPPPRPSRPQPALQEPHPGHFPGKTRCCHHPEGKPPRRQTEPLDGGHSHTTQVSLSCHFTKHARLCLGWQSLHLLPHCGVLMTCQNILDMECSWAWPLPGPVSWFLTQPSLPHQLAASPLTMTPTFAKLFSYLNVYLDTLKASYWGKYKLVIIQM